MIEDNFIDNKIEADLLAKNEEQRANHKSSGKLSASMLGDPTQWQILKILGTETKPLEEYVIRKFLRGNQIEDWAITMIPDVLEQQKLIEYKDCIGFADAIVDTKEWDNKVGVIPVEVKSVGNFKFKRIVSNKEADIGHILQAGYYALGLEKEHFAVMYCATDDLRVKIFIYKTEDYREEIDGIIDKFYKTLKSGEIPIFEPKVDWQKSLKYNKFPSWATLTEEEIKVKYQSLKLKQ